MSEMAARTETAEQPAVWEHRAALAEAELAACEEQVKALELLRDRLLDTLSESERRRAAVEELLAAHRASVSWQVTEPLRAAKRWWLAVPRRGPR